VLLVLNDRTPDGTDVSWIWDADTEGLVATGATLVVSGDRAYDMALRLAYSDSDRPAGPATLSVETTLKAAIQNALDRLPDGETLYVLPTYSAMLEVREILTGRGIL
jgi:UDP-N-acetylmuramyl tripeptide synthase